MPYEENFTRADWLSLGESGLSCGHGRLFLCGGFLGAAVTCAGLVRDLSREFRVLSGGVLSCSDRGGWSDSVQVLFCLYLYRSGYLPRI